MPDEYGVIEFEWDVDPADTALLVIDMQTGFLDVDSTFGRAGLNENQRAIIPNVARLVEVCRGASIPIIWSIQEHIRNDATHRKHKIPSHLEKRNIFVAARGTNELNIQADLMKVYREEDHLLFKHRASCFFDTNLATKLKMLGTQMLIISGVNSNYCVESTIREGYFHDFDIVVPKDCVAGSFPDLHESMLKNVHIYFGVVTSLQEMEQKLAGKTVAANT
jgi:ureidoacrylate peracid hydrolase